MKKAYLKGHVSSKQFNFLTEKGWFKKKQKTITEISITVSSSVSSTAPLWENTVSSL